MRNAAHVLFFVLTQLSWLTPMAQTPNFSISCRVLAEYGHSRLDWTSKNMFGEFESYDRFKNNSSGVGLNAHLFLKNEDAVGISTEVVRSTYSGLLGVFSEKNHQLKVRAFYTIYSENRKESSSGEFVRLSIGYAWMNSVNNNPIIIEFSSPNAFSTKWAGINYCIDYGHEFRFHDGLHLRVLAFWDIQLFRLTEAFQMADKVSWNASGRFNGSVVGLGVELGANFFRPKIDFNYPQND